MAIQELSVFGFRSLRKVDWHPQRLNLLVGPNASGKSNLIRCLELISSVAQGQLEKTISDEGGIVPILWDYQPGSCGWKMRIDPVDSPSDRIKDALTLDFELAQFGGGSGYEIAKDSLGNWYKFEHGEETAPYWIFKREKHRVFVRDERLGGLVKRKRECVANPDRYESESLLSHQITDLPTRIPTLARHALEGWTVHHDVHAERGSMMRRPATTQLSKKLEPDGSNLVTVLHTLYEGNPQFRNRVDEGMKAGFGEDYQRLAFQPAAAQQIQLAVQWKSSSQPHAGADLSDGTLRFLFLLTVLSHPEPAPLITIDEPEVGLHPSMLPIIAEYAADASQRTQLILTSHSPEFLDAFTALSPHVTLCHWEDGETHLYELESQMLGRWLEQYRLGHMFTRGDLEALALPSVEPVNDLEDRFKDMPSEDEAMSNLPIDAQGDVSD